MQKTEISKTDLVQIAKQTMLSKGLAPEFPLTAIEQLNNIKKPASLEDEPFARDMRHLLWFSIDNDDSKDLDQLTFAEKLEDNCYRAYVSIADVACLVPKDTPLDDHARFNTTSVYTPMIVFSMLPEKLSTDLTSLNPDEERMSIVVQMDMDENGEIYAFDVYQAYVFNYAKLAYNSVGPWIESGSNPPLLLEKIEDLDKQIRLQDEIAQKLKKQRYNNGALTFETYDPQPVIKNNRIVDLQEVKINRARELIENFMITANTTLTKFMQAKNLPAIRRVVSQPKRWDRIVNIAKEYNYELPLEPDSKELEKFLLDRRAKEPLKFPDLSLMIIKLLGRGEYKVALKGEEEGHFALALTSYTHATAPNRRYPDLIVQRLIKASIEKKPTPYSLTELKNIMAECTDKESRAEKVKRSVMKSVISIYLLDSIGKEFEAFVTGQNSKGTWIRLIGTAIEGKLVQGFQNVDVGDKIHVKLVDVNVDKGYLDFILL